MHAWVSGAPNRALLVGRADDVFCKTQKPGADFEASLRSSFQVHFEFHATTLDEQANHSSLLEKSIGFTDSQNGASCKFGQDLRNAFLFGNADKENVAGSRILVSREMHGPQGMTVDGLSLEDSIKLAVKRVRAGDAKRQRRVWGFRHFGRPLDEPGKVDQEASLDLIFSEIAVRADWVGNAPDRRQKESRAKRG
jgi:hypothetical protein